jgi:hypothetical protein
MKIIRSKSQNSDTKSELGCILMAVAAHSNMNDK